MKFLSIKKCFLFAVFALLLSCREGPKPIDKPIVDTPPAKSVPALNYSLIATHPHDTSAFTEGLFFNEGKLYESTGSPDNLPQLKSVFGMVDLKTGRLSQKAELDKTKYFGEGSVMLNGKIYQLTYQSQTGFVYHAKTFKLIKQFSYLNKEGWGLTTEGKNLIMSDGTNALTVIHPETFTVLQTILVSENNYAVDYINELEYVDGFIYANVWMTNNILKINAETGEVVGKLDFSSQATEIKNKYPYALEMNGIAYDPDKRTFFITGKLWPKMFEITLSPNI
jgi:glutaminyl-peptide cyclotransferase